jgi:CDP-glycerol glycerophosphotransferase
MYLTKEDRYIRRRLRQARKQAREFYYCRKYPINPKKIVFTTIEGTTGFSCNPKYIALELLRRRQDLDLVWLVDDMNKEFPAGIRKVKNTLKNRAYELSTAAVWVDNSRKQLECRKRPGQFYIQTWHGSLWLKPLGLERGKNFSRMAYYVSVHDSNMVDLLLTNSAWTELHAERGLLYKGNMMRVGTPRCDVLINGKEQWKKKIREIYNLPAEAHILMYAPTFRAGSQGTNRMIKCDELNLNFSTVIKSFEGKFGGIWFVFLRLHPQLAVRHLSYELADNHVIDVTDYDDIYELLAGCDAVLTDYSSVVFDGVTAGLPTFLYMEDYDEYLAERGHLVWNVAELPVPIAQKETELLHRIKEFDIHKYKKAIDDFVESIQLCEDGCASKKTVDYIEKMLVE